MARAVNGYYMPAGTDPSAAQSTNPGTQTGYSQNMNNNGDKKLSLMGYPPDGVISLSAPPLPQSSERSKLRPLQLYRAETPRVRVRSGPDWCDRDIFMRYVLLSSYSWHVACSTFGSQSDTPRPPTRTATEVGGEGIATRNTTQLKRA